MTTTTPLSPLCSAFECLPDFHFSMSCEGLCPLGGGAKVDGEKSKGGASAEEGGQGGRAETGRSGAPSSPSTATDALEDTVGLLVTGEEYGSADALPQVEEDDEDGGPSEQTLPEDVGAAAAASAALSATSMHSEESMPPSSEDDGGAGGAGGGAGEPRSSDGERRAAGEGKLKGKKGREEEEEEGGGGGAFEMTLQALGSCCMSSDEDEQDEKKDDDEGGGGGKSRDGDSAAPPSRPKLFSRRASSIHLVAATEKAVLEAETRRRYAALGLEEKLGGSKLRAELWSSYLRNTPGRADVLGKATYCEFRAMVPAGGGGESGAAPPGTESSSSPGGASSSSPPPAPTTVTSQDTLEASINSATLLASVGSSSLHSILRGASSQNLQRDSLRRLVRDVSMCLARERACRNVSFDPRGCLWQADVHSERADVVTTTADVDADVDSSGDAEDEEREEADGVERVKPYKMFLKLCRVDGEPSSSLVAGELISSSSVGNIGSFGSGEAGGGNDAAAGAMEAERRSGTRSPLRRRHRRGRSSSKGSGAAQQRGRSRSRGRGILRGRSRGRSKDRSRSKDNGRRTSAAAATDKGAATTSAFSSSAADAAAHSSSLHRPEPQFHEFVAAMQLIGKGPDAEALYVRITSAVKAAMIRVELPARLPMGKRGSGVGGGNAADAAAGGSGGEGQVRGFHAEYLLGDDITSGAFATVYEGTHRHTGRRCAIKVIAREKLTIAEEAAVLSEVVLHAAASDHPNVVTLIDFFEEQHNFYLVMELMGGDLFDHVKRPLLAPQAAKDADGAGGGKSGGIRKSKSKKEKEKQEKDDMLLLQKQQRQRGYAELDARDLVRNILRAVRHCHRRNIAHCDLKPKNVMLVSEGDETCAKLADFGLSSRTTGPDSLTRLCGSPLYVAPEVINRRPYDVSSDMWSVGALTYLLLGGTTPFTGSNLKEIFPKITAGKYDFSPEHDWENVSDEAKDFVRSLLAMDPNVRPTAHEALGCPWMKMDAKELARRDSRRANECLRTLDRALPKAVSPKNQERERKRFGSSAKGSMHNSSGSSLSSPRMKRHSSHHSSSAVKAQA